MPRPNSSKLPREIWKLMRRHSGTADDPDWAGLNVHPDLHATALVGGTASNGVYSIQVTGTDADGAAVDFTASFTRAAAETSAQVADELNDDFQAALATTLARVFVSTSLSTATITFVIVEGAELTFTVVDPGTATITMTYDGRVTRDVATSFPSQLGPTTQLALKVFARNSSGVLLARSNCTFNLQLVDVFDRDHPTLGAGTGAAVGVSDTTAVTGAALNRPITVACNGGRVTARLTTIANAPATTDNFEVWYREINQ